MTQTHHVVTIYKYNFEPFTKPVYNNVPILIIIKKKKIQQKNRKIGIFSEATISFINRSL